MAEGKKGEEESSETMAVLDFDMLCATVALQTQGFAKTEKSGEEFERNTDEFGGVQRMWEGDVFDCFDDRRIAIQSAWRQAAHIAQQKQGKEEEEEKLAQQKAREIEAFDQQNHRAIPQYSDRNHSNNTSGNFHGANSVKTTSFEEEALRTMKAFWLPSATPDAPIKIDAPSSATTCPEGKEKLKLKQLFPIHFTEDKNGDGKKKSELERSYICPSCKVTLTNTLALVVVSTCGHVFCKKCADRFVASDKVCLVCGKGCKEKCLVALEKGGTGFSGHDENLEAKDFKHLGSGSGLGLVRPAQKT